MQPEKEISPTKSQNQEHTNIHLFESETKRLKAYFRTAPAELVGCRILFGGSPATVRYAGPLLHQGRPANSENELWVGVEWDEPQRGKHNGTVNGYVYFTCGDLQGSIVKYDKIEFGYKLETGFFKRYFRVEQIYHAKSIYDQMEIIKASSASEQMKKKQRDELGRRKHLRQYDQQAYVETLRKNKVMIEFVGFDEIWNKIHNLDVLENISLSNSQICDLGGEGDLRKIFPNLTTLSFQENLLYDWNQVYLIGHELPRLKELTLARNQLREPGNLKSKPTTINVMFGGQPIQKSPIDIFPSLKSLVLINTGCNWKSIFNVLPAFPVVEQLVLCRNNMTDVENIRLEDCPMDSIKFLNLEECNISDFSTVLHFKNLKNLEKLILNKNKLSRFGVVDGFAQLKAISIEHNQVLAPLAISQIARITTIQYFNIRHNPIGDKMGNTYVRQRSVAEFPNLTVINGADLKKYERKDCEVFYLRETFYEYFNLRKVPDYDYDFQDFSKWAAQNHPRIEALIKKYGNPYEVQKKQIVNIIKEEVRQLDTKKAGGMMMIKIEYRAGLTKGQTENKKLPLSWTLSNLKNLFSKTLKIPVKSQKITFKSRGDANQQPMDEDHKNLYFYNLTIDSIVYLDILM